MASSVSAIVAPRPASSVGGHCSRHRMSPPAATALAPEASAYIRLDQRRISRRQIDTIGQIVGYKHLMSARSAQPTHRTSGPFPRRRGRDRQPSSSVGPARHWTTHGSPASRRCDRSFLLTDLDAGGYEVDGFVVVEAGCHDGPGGTRLAGPARAILAGHRRRRRAGTARTRTTRGAALAAAARHPLTVGVRRNVQDEPPGFLLEPPMVAGRPATGGARAALRRLRPRPPAQRAHRAGRPLPRGHVRARPPRQTSASDQRREHPWFDDLSALARRPNVVAKLSGLTTEADHEHWRPADSSGRTCATRSRCSARAGACSAATGRWRRWPPPTSGGWTWSST